MNSRKEIVEIGKFLPIYYFKAKSLLKEDDYFKSWQYLRALSAKIINKLNIEVEVINLNDDFNFDGSFLLANHQSNYDIVSLLANIDSPIKFIAKKELFKLPLFSTFIKLSKSYSLDRSDARQGVKVFKEALHDVDTNNSNIVIFPEGSRAKTNLMLEFNSGLFNIIKRTKKCLIPLYIEYVSNKKIKLVIGKKLVKDEFKFLNGLELRALIYEKICELKKNYTENQVRYRFLGLGDSITFGEDYQGKYIGGFYQQFVAKVQDEGLLASELNLAIPKIRIEDVKSLILNDDYLTQLTSNLSDQELITDLVKKRYASVQNLLKNSDYLIMSIGANDILQIVKQGKLTDENILKEFENVYQKTNDLLKLIYQINPHLKIFLIGLYFPYPHSKVLQKFNKLSTLDAYYHKLEINHQNLKCLLVSNEIFKHKDSYLPDKRNIHLSAKGYEYIAWEIVKHFGEL